MITEVVRMATRKIYIYFTIYHNIDHFLSGYYVNEYHINSCYDIIL